jgi:hypothetical protein
VGPQDAVNDRAFAVHVCSSAMRADDFVREIRTRLPKRWLHVTRFDADWSDFRDINIDADDKMEVSIADNWHAPEEN